MSIGQQGGNGVLDQSSPLAQPLLAKHGGDAGAEAREAQQPKQPLSRNVPLTLVYTFFIFASRSVWTNSVLSAYVFLLENHNAAAVGYITAAQGIMQLVSSVPAGYFADRYRRDTLLRVSAVVGFLAIGTTLFAAWNESYIWLTAGLATWGTFWGVSNTSILALFADSIPTGDRSYYFTQRSMLITSGTCMGPILALAMFYYMGDKWTIQACAIVVAAGQFVSLPAIVLLCFFRDEFANTESEVVELPQEESARMLPVESDTETETTSLQAPSDSGMEMQPEPKGKYCCCCPEDRKIPIHIASSDVIFGLALGVSVRYFPVFFLDYLKLHPIIVQVLYLASRALQVVLMRLAQMLSKRIGRCKTSAMARWTGISLMVGIIVSFSCFASPSWVICVLYVVRTAFMNSTTALTKSVLMDHVPKHERGKWSALESVNMFTWSGSAVFGGFLVGWHGMMFNFSVATAFLALGTAPLIRVIWWETLEDEVVIVQPIEIEQQQNGADPLSAPSPKDEGAGRDDKKNLV